MKSKSRNLTSERSEAGMALLTTILVMTMTTGLGIIMYLSVNSDLLINGYYSNFRSAFYAADSGLNIARAELVNQITSAVPAAFAIPPIANPANLAAATQTYITNTYGNTTALNSGQAANSW